MNKNNVFIPCWLLKWKLLVNCHCCLFSPSLSFSSENSGAFPLGVAHASSGCCFLPYMTRFLLLPSFFWPGLQQTGLEWASSPPFSWDLASELGESQFFWAVCEIWHPGASDSQACCPEGRLLRGSALGESILLADWVFSPLITGILVCSLYIFILLDLI